MTKKFTLYTSLNTIKHPSLVFKQLPFYHNGHVMTEPFTLGVTKVKACSVFDEIRQNGRGFNRDWEECKIPMLVSLASNQVHFKVFFIFKGSSEPNPIQPSSRHFFISGTTDTISPRVKVMKSTELVVPKKYDSSYKTIWITSETF